jgi:flagellar basal-body rod protein FlgC
MLAAISTAAGGLVTQSQRLQAAAAAIAAQGATPPADTSPNTEPTAVRIGALPVGDPLERVVTLVEAETAYRANAAVLGTAVDMLDALLDTLDAK